MPPPFFYLIAIVAVARKTLGRSKCSTRNVFENVT